MWMGWKRQQALKRLGIRKSMHLLVHNKWEPNSEVSQFLMLGSLSPFPMGGCVYWFTEGPAWLRRFALLTQMILVVKPRAATHLCFCHQSQHQSAPDAQYSSQVDYQLPFWRCGKVHSMETKIFSDHCFYFLHLMEFGLPQEPFICLCIILYGTSRVQTHRKGRRFI